LDIQQNKLKQGGLL